MSSRATNYAPIRITLRPIFLTGVLGRPATVMRMGSKLSHLGYVIFQKIGILTYCFFTKGTVMMKLYDLYSV